MASDANGLCYMRARYYNIDIMRFINQDILTGSIDSSQSLNRYAYVEGNPVNFLDPFGLDEYRVDTDGMHVFAGLLGILGGELSAHGAPVRGAVITAIANGFDIGLTINDMYYHIVDKEYIEVLKDVFNIVVNIVGIVTAGITSGKYREAQYIAKIEGRLTGYEVYLTQQYDKWTYIGDVTSGGTPGKIVNYIKNLRDYALYVWKTLKED